jgi:hypothetical protein
MVEFFAMLLQHCREGREDKMSFLVRLWLINIAYHGFDQSTCHLTCIHPAAWPVDAALMVAGAAE